jgi:broad specificity phosphatase PhoE
MVNILLVRHAFSITNKAGCFTGRLDVPLDDIGRSQAILLSEYLRSNYKIDAIYSSDLSRVIDTVKPLSDFLGININLDPLLRETNIGRWQGKTVSEIACVEPELVEEMKKEPYYFRFPEGECESEVYQRAIASLSKIVSENEGKTVVIATHGGIIRSLLRKFLNVPPDKTDLIPLVNNASVTVIEYESGIYTPRQIGADSFLKDISTAHIFK